MSKKTKFWLITAASLVLAGGLIFGGVMTMLGWDFSKLSTTKLVSNTHTITEDFQNITLVADTADITFVPSADGTISVVCQEFENQEHTVSVRDGTLAITLENQRKWYDYIGIHFGQPKITITLPQGAYGSLAIKNTTGNVVIPSGFRFGDVDITQNTGKVDIAASAAGAVRIKTTTGDIRVENAAVDSLNLTVTTGNVTIGGVTCTRDLTLKVTTGKSSITNTKCKNLLSDGGTGKLDLQNVIADEKFSLERSTGDITFTDCDAGEIFVETDTGDVTGSLLSDKVFFAETDTGRVDVPKSATGGSCEIETDTGDIQITIK